MAMLNQGVFYPYYIAKEIALTGHFCFFTMGRNLRGDHEIAIEYDKTKHFIPVRDCFVVAMYVLLSTSLL